MDGTSPPALTPLLTEIPIRTTTPFIESTTEELYLPQDNYLRFSSNNYDYIHQFNPSFINESLPFKTWVGRGLTKHSVFMANQGRDVNYWVLCIFGLWVPASISLFGLVTNLLSAVVISRMGFKTNSCNITLLGLTIADIFVVLLHLWDTVLLGALVYEAVELYTDQHYIYVVLVSRPKALTTQISCVMTALLSAQRCISVVLPFKLKYVFSPSRTAIAVIISYLVVIATYSPVYLQMRVVDMIRISFQAAFTEENQIPVELVFASHILHKVIIRPLCILFVIGCNVAIQYKLTSSRIATCRSSSSTTNKRDRKATKMLMVISIVFVICYLPESVYTMYEMMTRMTLSYTFEVYADIINTVLGALNSSCNFLILYRMGSNFRNTFKAMCGRSRD